MRRNINTGALATSFPFTSADLTQENGILYGINMHNNGLVIFDRFTLENANMVVFAKSGAGKSFAVKRSTPFYDVWHRSNYYRPRK